MRVTIREMFGDVLARVVGGPGPKRVMIFNTDLAGRKRLAMHTGYQMTADEYRALQEAIAEALRAAGRPVPPTLVPHV